MTQNSINTTMPIGVATGGTGLAAATAFNLLIGDGTNALALVAPSATAGVPVISQGAAANPIYGTAVVAGGGTGIVTTTAYSVICAGTAATNPFQSLAALGAAGTVLTSNGAAALPSFQAPAAGGDVTAAINLTDLAVVRGDGGAKGVKTSTMLITDNGEMTNPSQPAFFATLQDVAGDVTGNGLLYLLGDTDVGATLTEIFDQNADLDPGSADGAIFTAPLSRRYFLTTLLNISNITSAMTNQSISIYTSNRIHVMPASSPASFRNSSNNCGFTLSVLADMDAADTSYVEIRISNGVGDTADMISHGTHNYNSFSGFLAF